ncbi:MAG TPA: hypothetical protein VFH76_18295 [Kribbella sp.]|nr:hypothetical protein [Kribbella sp.]
MVGRWRARPFQVRLEVEDGLVTIQVSGVLGGDADRVIRDELLAVCRLAKAIRLDLCAVSEVSGDLRLPAFLGQLRSDCELTRCRLQVTATHPLVLQVLQSWGNRLEYLNGHSIDV